MRAAKTITVAKFDKSTFVIVIIYIYSSRTVHSSTFLSNLYFLTGESQWMVLSSAQSKAPTKKANVYRRLETSEIIMEKLTNQDSITTRSCILSVVDSSKRPSLIPWVVAIVIVFSPNYVCYARREEKIRVAVEDFILSKICSIFYSREPF